MAACGEDDLPEKETQEEDAEEKMEEGDSDDSSGGSDDETDEQLKQFEQQVIDNPYQYDGHIQLIQKLRIAGELSRLQEARERMAATFPLTAELWIDWIEDEKKVMQEDDRSHIISLFERGIKDYTSVDLWLEFIQFSIGGMAAEGGLENVRRVCERAITATGLNVAKGWMIWEAYREYENAILAGLQPAPGAVLTGEQQEQQKAQTKKVVSVFRRQLSVPLNSMQTTWEEFKEFAEDEEQEKVKPMYEKALAKLEKLLPLEDSVTKAENLTKFEDYIDVELENGEPARIQCIFERALTTHCLVPRLWQRYTQYLDAELKIPDVVVSVYDRAVRNCPWSPELWCGYGRALERYGRSHSEIKDVFVRALSGGFTQGQEYLAVWNAHLDYLRRHVQWGQGQEASEDETELWQTFEQAIQHLFDNFGAEGDPECTLQRYKARLKAKHCGDMAAARDEWNEVMQAGHGNKAAMWMEYFNLERSYGDHKHSRKILQRALNSVNDWPESIVQTYIRFEREEGDSVDAYDTAICRCEAQMVRIEDRRAKAAEKEAAQEAQKKTARKEKKSAKKAAEKQAEQEASGAKQRASQPQGCPEAGMGTPKVYVRGNKKGESLAQPDTEVRPYKRKAENQSKEEDSEGTFKVPVSPPQLPPSKKKAPPPGYKGPKAPPPGYKGPKAPPPGYKGPPPPGHKEAENTEEPPEKKAKVEATTDSDKPLVIDSSRENRTAFVSNLDFKSTEEDVRKVLSEVGPITDFRLVKTFTGKSKGYAYVEFEDELMVGEAVKLDRTPIDGRPMFISRCNERSNNATSFKYATHMERNKLFVRGLPFSLSQDDIHELFSQHGELKEVRLVTYRSGSSKGLAYVEFKAENDASQAVMKMDGHVIGEHTINVAISNPPQRKAPAGSSFTAALGGGRRDTGGRGRSGTQVILTPRSVQRRPPDTPATKSGEENGDKPANMSNQDFRAMLLKR